MDCPTCKAPCLMTQRLADAEPTYLCEACGPVATPCPKCGVTRTLAWHGMGVGHIEICNPCEFPPAPTVIGLLTEIARDLKRLREITEWIHSDGGLLLVSATPDGDSQPK